MKYLLVLCMVLLFGCMLQPACKQFKQKDNQRYNWFINHTNIILSQCNVYNARLMFLADIQKYTPEERFLIRKLIKQKEEKQ